MVNASSPSTISLNELGTNVPKNTIVQLLFSYNVYIKEGTNPHGSVVFAVDKKLSCQHIDVNLPNFVAVRIRTDNKQFDIASDFNAKHQGWGGPQVNTKGRDLVSWIIQNNLNVFNSGMKTSLRSNTTIDLVFFE